jgi:hypothetical protein
MMLLSENKEIIFKSLIVIGSISLSIGLGNYIYDYYKELKEKKVYYNQKLKKSQEDFYNNIENIENIENNENK